MTKAPDSKPTFNGYSAIVNKVLNFFVNYTFSITVGVMGGVHAILLIIFWIAGVTPLVIFNTFSVVVYTFCFILCRFGHIMPADVSIIIEVTIYSAVSTYYVGLRCGTYCFLFSIIPIIIFFGCSLFKGKQRRGIIVMLVLNFATFAVLYIRFFNVEPLYMVNPTIMLILVVFSAFAMVFAVMFYNAVYIYTSEKLVDSLEKKNEQLSADAHEDELTSLLNRRGFLPIIKSLMKSDKTQKFCIAF